MAVFESVEELMLVTCMLRLKLMRYTDVTGRVGLEMEEVLILGRYLAAIL